MNSASEWAIRVGSSYCPLQITHDLQSPTAVGLTRQASGYEVGDIGYWTPGHALVIFYAQNGEIISNLQEMGYIDSGVEIWTD
jgi:hypothetical protein